MKITGNIFTNNYWLMKFAPLALALAAVVIFFCNLYAHIWNGAIVTGAIPHKKLSIKNL